MEQAPVPTPTLSGKKLISLLLSTRQEQCIFSENTGRIKSAAMKMETRRVYEETALQVAADDAGGRIITAFGGACFDVAAAELASLGIEDVIES